MLNQYYLLALFAAGFLALANNFVKKTTSSLAILHSLAIRVLFSSVIISAGIIISTFYGARYSLDVFQFFQTVFYAIFGFAGLFCLYKAVESDEISSVFPIINANAIGVVIFGFLFFGVQLTLLSPNYETYFTSITSHSLNTNINKHLE
jgi:uncharacterized membrane protein